MTDWIYIWGGILVVLWGIWLFADFAADLLAAHVRGWIVHD